LTVESLLFHPWLGACSAPQLPNDAPSPRSLLRFEQGQHIHQLFDDTTRRLAWDEPLFCCITKPQRMFCSTGRHSTPIGGLAAAADQKAIALNHFCLRSFGGTTASVTSAIPEKSNARAPAGVKSITRPGTNGPSGRFDCSSLAPLFQMEGSGERRLRNFHRGVGRWRSLRLRSGHIRRQLPTSMFLPGPALSRLFPQHRAPVDSLRIASMLSAKRHCCQALVGGGHKYKRYLRE
jgi:hypothetical protein